MTRLRPPAGLANARRLRRDPLGFFRDLAATGEALHDLRLGPFRVTVVSDPALAWELLTVHADATVKGRALQRARIVLGDGLLTSEGSLHAQRRRALQPLFGRPAVSARGSRFVEAAVAAMDDWWDDDELALDGALAASALAGASSFLVGAHLTGDGDRLRADLGEVMGSGVLLSLPTPAERRRRQAAGRLHRAAERVVDAHVPSTGRPDAIDLLHRAGVHEPRALRDEVLTLLLAGHETTAVLLTWAFVAVATDARVRDELERELDARLAAPDGWRAATPDDDLPYTTAVLAETLRLWPPAWVVGRRTTRPITLGETPLPAGRLVLVSPAALHRDARWWPEPERFRPERWLASDGAGGLRFDRTGGTRPRGAFLPFGAGPRRCVGENLAWAQATVILATVSARWRIEVLGPPPEPAPPTITLRPTGPVRVRLADRSQPGSGALGRRRRLSAGSAMDARNGLAG